MVGKIDKKLFDTTQSITNDIAQIQSVVGGSIWANTIAAYDGYDGYLARIYTTAQQRLGYVDTNGIVQISEAAGGFLSPPTPTTHSFELLDIPYKVTNYYKQNNNIVATGYTMYMNGKARHIVCSPGMTHINVYASITYKGGSGGSFGVSDEVNINLGVGAYLNNTILSEAYATAKTFSFGVLPSSSVSENYVVSIPISGLDISTGSLIDFVPRIQIENSTKVDGGPGSDPSPILEITSMRIVTSSYSIAGYISEVDGSNESVAATIGAIL
jgi:hypothetical protein